MYAATLSNLEQNRNKIFPTHQDINVGDALVITCENFQPQYRFWIVNKGFVPQEYVREGGNSIHVPSVSLNNSGEYTCIGVKSTTLSPAFFFAVASVKLLGKSYRYKIVMLDTINI